MSSQIEKLDDSNGESIASDAGSALHSYKFLVEITEEDGIFSAVALNLLGVGSCGSTEEEAIANFKEAAAGVLESYKEDDTSIPWEATQDELNTDSKRCWVLVDA
jgi:predicted RNase H-like HicB family nuclease